MTITKTKLDPAKTLLSGNYSIDVQDIEDLTKVSAELGKALQEAIDQEALHDVFLTTTDINDWYKVNVMHGTYHLVTNEWLADNLKGDFHCFGNYWYFKDQSDATAFALRWKN